MMERLVVLLIVGRHIASNLNKGKMMRVTILLLLVLLTSACKTRPGTPTAFLSDTHLLESGKLFQKEWQDAKFSLKDYDKIAILTVDTSFLKDMSWWEKANVKNYEDSGIYPGARADKNQDPAKSLARYYTYHLKASFEKEGSPLKLVPIDETDEKTLVLRIALTELVPVKKLLLGFSLIGDGSLKGGTVAMEAKLENGKTGQLLMMLTDREVNNKFHVERENSQLNYIVHAKPVVKEWTASFQKLFTK